MWSRKKEKERNHGVGEGRPVLRRHLEGNEGESRTRKAGLEIMSIRRTRKEEVILVLKKGGDVSAFQNEIDLAVGERAAISALVSTRSLEIRDLDETVEKEKVVSALRLALGRLAFEGSCRLFTRFGGVKTAVIRPAEADAARLLQLGKLRIGWVACRVREHVEVARWCRLEMRRHGTLGQEL